MRTKFLAETGGKVRRAAAVSVVNIVAHQDDDLLFMCPELSETIRAGAQSMTVYVTAGEAHFPPNGSVLTPLPTREACKNLCGHRDFTGHTREQYIDCRRRGVLAAYTAMLAGQGSSEPLWKGEVLAVGDERYAERYISTVDPGVSLVFLNLPENADTHAEGGPQALRGLWFEEGASASTVTPAGALTGTDTFRYRHEDLVQALVSLMRVARPTLIRILDAHPDTRYSSEWEFNEHTDHVMTALFSLRACARYSESCGDTRPAVVSYRGYNTAATPENLSPGVPSATKTSAFWAYAGYDSEIGVGNEAEYRAWLRRMRHRWPTGTRWATTDDLGRIWAFSPLGRVLRSWRKEPGGGWIIRELCVPGSRIVVPGVTMCRNAMGQLQVFVLTYDDWFGSTGNGPTVCSVRLTEDGKEPVWRDLGSPESAGGFPYHHIGLPVCAMDTEGRIQVYLRNAHGGLSSISQSFDDPDVFGGWVDHGGADIQEDPAVAMNAQGDLEVFAATTEGILRWRRITGTACLRPLDQVTSAVPCSPPAPFLGRDGQTELYYRVARSGQVAVYRTGSEDARPDSALDGSGGVGPVAVLAACDKPDGGVVLLGRNDRGGISMTHLGGSNGEPRPAWTDLGNVVVSEPALVRDPGGCVTALALGADGWLHWAAQKYPALGAALGPWQRVSS